MIQFTIPGEPRTKKTGQRLITNRRTGKPMIIPSTRTLTWTQMAAPFMRRAMQGKPPLEGPVAVVYWFYRQKNVADLGGMEAALDDALQGIVIKNDRQIVGRTSVREIDRANPRVEVSVCPR